MLLIKLVKKSKFSKEKESEKIGPNKKKMIFENLIKFQTLPNVRTIDEMEKLRQIVRKWSSVKKRLKRENLLKGSELLWRSSSRLVDPGIVSFSSILEVIKKYLICTLNLKNSKNSNFSIFFCVQNFHFLLKKKNLFWNISSF